MKKSYITAEQLLNDSFELALLILNSGFQPDLIIGIWRGGTPVAITIHEALKFCGNNCDHLSIKASSYTGIGERQHVELEGIDYLASKIAGKKHILVIDDVFDSGQSMARISDEIQLLVGVQIAETRIAVPYFKPTHNTTNRLPDYYLHETNAWLVFPHELLDLKDEEIINKPGPTQCFEKLLDIRDKRLSISEK